MTLRVVHCSGKFYGADIRDLHYCIRLVGSKVEFRGAARRLSFCLGSLCKVATHHRIRQSPWHMVLVTDVSEYAAAPYPDDKVPATSGPHLLTARGSANLVVRRLRQQSF